MMTQEEYARVRQRVGTAMNELSAAMGEAWRNVPVPTPPPADAAAVLTQAASPPEDAVRPVPGTGGLDILDPKHMARFNYAAGNLDVVLNDQLFTGGERAVGFVLVLFPHGETDPMRCRFVANGMKLPEILQLMRGQVARFEARAAEQAPPVTTKEG